MISIEDAKRIIRKKIAPIKKTLTVSLNNAGGRVLAQEVEVDSDIPPFNRCNMDGYAVVSSDGEGEFEILEVVPAGASPNVRVVPGKVCKVMTGAPLPEGADAVVRVEETGQVRNGRVWISGRVKPGKNMTPAGLELKKGDTILKKGTLLRAQEISMLASAGCARPQVLALPSVALLATGAELMEPDKKPGPGKIRNSNAYGLMAQVRGMGLKALYMGIAGDDRESLREKVRQGVKKDVFLITGGMSVGDFDIAPAILMEAGVNFWFDKVRIKPGKPIHFGTTSGGCVVFGLPGNPVSSMVVFEQFVKPGLKALMGHTAFENVRERGRLKHSFSRRDALREEYLPVFVEREEKGFSINQINYHGSGHMMALTRANSLMRIEAGVEKIPADADCEFQWL